MVEEDAVIAAEIAVYDPQNTTPMLFSYNGSTATRLAYVLNSSQVTALTGESDPVSAAEQLRSSEGAEVVIVKAGSQGAYAVGPAGVHAISAYKSEQIFKIGSGDIFTAAFAYYWGERGDDYYVAADKASRSVCWYCNTRQLRLPDAVELGSLMPVPFGTQRLVYLAGPFLQSGKDGWSKKHGLLFSR